jgi:hypothetical protein
MKIRDSAGMRNSDLLFLLRFEDRLAGSLVLFDQWLQVTANILPYSE